MCWASCMWTSVGFMGVHGAGGVDAEDPPAGVKCGVGPCARPNSVRLLVPSRSSAWYIMQAPS
eukprot:10304523-Alexandrium_andersonii.AAC.1